MFGNFEEDARKVLVNAKKEMYELNHPYVSSEHLLLAILKDDNEISQRLKTYNLDYQIFKKEVIKIIGKGSKPSQWFLYTPLLKRILENAVNDAKENNNGVVTVNHLFSSLLEEGEGVAIRIMIGMNIDVDELYGEFADRLVSSSNNKKLLIEEIGVDLNKKAINGKLDPVTGRDEEIKRVLEILSRRTKNNPLLIGEAGVGKTAIVEELANMIVSGEVPVNLKNKRIISLDMASSVAGTKYRGEFEERMNKIIKEIEDNDDIILFIDEVHTLVGAGGAEGAIDASNIFKPALSRGKIRCIGATTVDEYKKYIEKDSALERRFQRVLIEEPNVKTVKDILMNLKEIYEGFHKVIIDEEIIDLIISLSEKYIYNRRQPDKAIDILDEVCAKVSLKESKNLKEYSFYNKKLKDVIKNKKKAILENDFDTASKFKNAEFELMNKINNLELSLYKKGMKKVTKTDVASVLNVKTGIPIYELLNEKTKMIKQTEKLLSKNIIGQEKAVKSVSNIAKKIKLGFNDKCYSFLFCGPSGVGKTLLARELGNNLVGQDNVIKMDMSEYKEAHSISKIIGAPAGYVGYEDTNNVLESIRNKPYSVLILDEIEKAHSNIINLFLQVLDEGKIRNSRGKEIRFDNVVIIMTSNVGFHEANLGFNNMNSERVKLNDNFSIPFMNRVDNVIVFNSLSKDDILKIINMKLKQFKLKYKGKINIKLSRQINEEICDLSNFKDYGARKIDKIIKDKLESIVIDGIINNNKDIYIKSLKIEV
jgi:ATP-dependent Clp protease ATP-binding subunit ClpC